MGPFEDLIVSSNTWTKNWGHKKMLTELISTGLIIEVSLRCKGSHYQSSDGQFETSKSSAAHPNL